MLIIFMAIRGRQAGCISLSRLFRAHLMQYFCFCFVKEGAKFYHVSGV